MIVDWTDEFDRWLTNAGEQGGKLLEVAVALLQALNDLPAKPDEEFPTFKRVRQARSHEPWRAAYPTTPTSPSGSSTGSPPTTKSCSRLPGPTEVHRDVFYASAAARGEAIVDAWLRQKGSSHD